MVMMTSRPTLPLVSVIIPTMASSERAKLLLRAIGSIRASSLEPIRIIVVINGERFDLSVRDWLQSQPDVDIEWVLSASAPGAILRGRECVRTEFFSTLDDDDEYLPCTTERRILLLRANPEADVLISNAYIMSSGVDRLFYQNLPEVATDPLICLLRRNWLTSGNALFRTTAIGLPYFQGYHPYAEWTWLGFRLALDKKRIVILNEAVCRHHDTHNSLSKSHEYVRSYIPLFQRMLECSPHSAAARMIRRKISASYHDASVSALRAGLLREAWREHWNRVIQPGGLRYLPYTRYLFK